MQGVSEAFLQLPTASWPSPNTKYVQKTPKLLLTGLSGRYTMGRVLWGRRTSPGGQKPAFLPLVVMTDTVVASQTCMCSASPSGVCLQIKWKKQQMLSHYFTRNWMIRSRKRKGRKELCQKQCVSQWPGLSYIGSYLWQWRSPCALRKPVLWMSCSASTLFLASLGFPDRGFKIPLHFPCSNDLVLPLRHHSLVPHSRFGSPVLCVGSYMAHRN